MRILVKIIALIALILALLVTGFAMGYPIGMNMGFESGSEWAMLQAKLAAREAGVIMPVYYEDGLFHVVIRRAADSQRKPQEQKVPNDDIIRAVSVVLAESGMVGTPEPEVRIPWVSGEDQSVETACVQMQVMRD